MTQRSRAVSKIMGLPVPARADGVEKADPFSLDIKITPLLRPTEIGSSDTCSGSCKCSTSCGCHKRTEK
jgi:hypothetical protein